LSQTRSPLAREVGGFDGDPAGWHLALAAVRIIGVERRVAGLRGGRVAVDDREFHGGVVVAVAHEEVPVRLVVDQVAVVRVHGGHREVDVGGGHPERRHRVDKRLSLNPAASHRLDLRGARVVPAGEFAGLDELLDRRRGELHVVLVDLHVAPVEHLGVLPVEVVVDEPLALRGVLQVDPADDVRDAGEVVVDAGLEVEHGPTAVVGRFLARVRRVDHPKRNPVAERGILVLDVGPHAEDHLAGGILAVDHRRELLVNRLGVLVAVGARLGVVFERREVVAGTRAGVGAAGIDQVTGVVVVGLQPVGGLQHAVGLEPEVRDVFEDGVVRVHIGAFRLRVGVVEPADELAVIPLLVRPDHCGHARVADVPRAVGVRRGAHHDLAVLGVREVREDVVVLLVFGLELRELVGRELAEPVTALGLVHAGDPVYDGRDDPGYLVAVRSKVGVLAHERAHDGTHVRVVAVFERVEQRGGLAGRLDALAEFVVHALRLSGSAQKRRGTAVEGATRRDAVGPGSTRVRLRRRSGAAAEGPRIGHLSPAHGRA